MNHELCYTSAPRGLFPGTAGFSVVKCTAGMPGTLREVLESMSTYRPVYPLYHAQASRNPVCISSLTVSAGGRRWHVLSRICDAGPDHTQRSNFFAHHIALPAGTASFADPAWLASQPQVFLGEWDSRTEELPACRPLPNGSEAIRPCSSWMAITGDAGWAGEVADKLLARGKVYLVFNEGQPMLPLVSELFALLPQDQRWNATFSTYFCSLPAGIDCRLRCVVAGSAEARAASGVGSLVLDVTQALGRAPDGPLAEAARTGRVVPATRSQASSLPLSKPPESWQPTMATRKPSTPTGAMADANAVSSAPRAHVSMPPLNSFQAAPARGLAGGASWLAIGAAVGILVGVGAVLPFFLHARQSWIALEQDLVNAKKSHADEVNSLHIAAADSAKRTKERDGQIGKLENQLAGAATAKINLRTEIDNLRTEKSELDITMLRVKGELRDVMAAKEIAEGKLASLAQGHKPSPSESPKPNEQSAKPPQPVSENGTPTKTRSSLLPDTKDDKKLTIGKLDMQGKIKSIALENAAEIGLTKRENVPNQWVLKDGDVTIAELSVSNNELQFQWKPGKPELRAKLPKLRDNLINSVVVVDWEDKSTQRMELFRDVAQ